MAHEWLGDLLGDFLNQVTQDWRPSFRLGVVLVLFTVLGCVVMIAARGERWPPFAWWGLGIGTGVCAAGAVACFWYGSRQNVSGGGDSVSGR
jgi:hypothetical protein